MLFRRERLEMKKLMPEKCRITSGMFASSFGMQQGMFIIPHHRIAGYLYQCMVSSGMGWEHVSITLQNNKKRIERCPTWDEMCYIKDLFWNKDEAVVQYHPPESQYVNNHPYCLHLWRPTELQLPLPDPIMVGIKV